MRAVPEWRGKTDDSAIPARVRLRILLTHNGVCPRCARKLLPGHWDLDHKIALALGGEHRETNLEPVCTDPCHRQKTKEDRRAKAKTDKKLKAHWGIKKPKHKIPYRRFNGEIVDPNRKRRP